MKEYQYKNLTTTANTQVATGKGILKRVTVNKATAVVVGLYDGVGVTTSPIGILKASAAEGSYEYDCYFANGLYVSTGVGGDVTIIYAQ